MSALKVLMSKFLSSDFKRHREKCQKILKSPIFLRKVVARPRQNFQNFDFFGAKFFSGHSRNDSALFIKKIDSNFFSFSDPWIGFQVQKVKNSDIILTP